MKIHGVRLGFANNSSSTHSIVILRKPQGVIDDGDSGDFGWNHFVAKSREAKQHYLAITLGHALRRDGLSSDVAMAVAESWIGSSKGAGGDYDESGSIDHQSMMELPVAWSGKGVDAQFFAELQAWVMREDVAILGGNDNDDTAHPLADESDEARWYTKMPLEGYGVSVARKDSRGFWTIFNRKDGTKIRLSFVDGDFEGAPTDVPELVDVKITDFCPYGCSYCYTDSTTSGKHGDVNAITRLAAGLGAQRVFEVAIGGGEPTLHPNFVRIMESFREAGVVPNFTTRNLAWLRDDVVREPVVAAMGSFAYSVDGADQVSALAKTLQKYTDIDPHGVSIQYVVGTDSPFALWGIMRECAKHGFRLTLLGPKEDGRGRTLFPVKRHMGTCAQALDEIAKARKEKIYVSVAVDTAFVANCGAAALTKAGVDTRLYAAREGDSSGYIDAVAGTVAGASYGRWNVPKKITAWGQYDGVDEEVISLWRGLRAKEAK